MKITVKTLPCPECHKTTEVEMTEEQASELASGKHIQTIFPDWEPSKRELLITGMHPECWDKVFAEEES